MTYIFKMTNDEKKRMRFLTLKVKDHQKALQTIAKRCGVSVDQIRILGYHD